MEKEKISRIRVRCPECNGTGSSGIFRVEPDADPPNDTYPCHECDGKGEICDIINLTGEITGYFPD